MHILVYFNVMEFKREIYDKLIEWKHDGKRKPLLLMGARQIGKTTLLKRFGSNEYDDLVYVNLEKQKDIHAFFTGNKDPKLILEKLSLLYGKDIISGKSLIILDEIQECRDAIITLKYFQEEKPEIHIIGAGSLLGLSMGNDRSFPVGKVEFLDMFPLSFSEYLMMADANLFKAYHKFLDKNTIEPLLDAFLKPLQKLHKEYVLFGGMPEVASDYLENRNVESAQKIQDQILRAYQLDFVKHAEKTTSTKIQQVWNSIASQLGKENKKFIYKVIRSGARAREYEKALQWLIQAGLVYKVSRIEKPGIPLKSYEDLSSFKLYIFETGLLMRLAGLDPQTFISGDQFFKEFKGAIAENYVAQELRKIYGYSPFYWTSNGKAEIDYIIKQKGKCIPIKVKSGEATKAKSLALYKKLFKPNLRIRISNLNLKLTDDLLNIPLFYASQTKVLIEKTNYLSKANPES
jgi:predicted AAA+ superfamily ATPase